MPGRGTCRHLLAAGGLLLLAGCGDQGGGDLLAPASAPGTAVVVMQPTAPLVRPGDEVTVSVLILDAMDAVSVPFKLRFDADSMEFLEGAQGSFMAQGDAPVVFLAAASEDTVNVGLALLGAQEGVSGDGELCTLRFRILPGAAERAGYLDLRPYASQVFASGLREMPSEFRPLRLRLRERTGR